MAIAEVIINTDVKKLDYEFHYEVPDNACVGMRVEVPFGIGNRRAEGYIIGFVSSSRFKLKPITRIIDTYPMLTQSTIELARYISKAYLCPLNEAIRLMLPPSVSVRFERELLLKQPNYKPQTTGQRDIINALTQFGGSCEENKLLEAAGQKNKTVLNNLVKAGAVAVINKQGQGVKEQTRRIAYLNLQPEEAEDIISTLGAAMGRVVLLLLDYSSLPVSDIIQSANCTYATINALKEKDIITIEQEEVYRTPFSDKDFNATTAYLPTAEQKLAIDTINAGMAAKQNQTILLHGVTGSGKTEVFLQSVTHCINMGKNAIILVPEIALTPQMVKRFISRLGNNVAVLHSGLSLGERYDEWRRIKNGLVKVVVGARSAIFAPFENIGLIVIDEEHEQSYKSESSPRYNAREVAAYRAEQNNALLLLASATPSLDSYYNAKEGNYKLLELSLRYNNAPLPEVAIIDMGLELSQGNRCVISRRLQEEIRYNLENKQQTILFLNRRGHSTFVSCRSCGYAMACPHCSITLTYHSALDSLQCHYCGFKAKNVKECPSCKSTYIRHFGAGTQKVEEELRQLFPQATILRMDMDTTKEKMSHAKLLNSFENEHIDILLGTQMVTKGLDFPMVTLVGVLAADAMLNLDDYRAAERAFSQLTQVCGRSGRGDLPGRAVIQTYKPEDNTIQLAKLHDYKGFYEGEIALRKSFVNPPFSRLISITMSCYDDFKTKTAMDSLSKELRTQLQKPDMDGVCIQYFGPYPAPVARIKNQYRYRVLLKCNNSDKLLALLGRLYNKHVTAKETQGIMLGIDINPNSMF